MWVGPGKTRGREASERAEGESSAKTITPDLEQVSLLVQAPVSEWLRRIKGYLLHGLAGVLQN